jgi:hypothetical protein
MPQCGKNNKRFAVRFQHWALISWLLCFAEVKMAEYPASVVAASALLAAAGEVAGAHLPAFHAAVAACPFVNSVSMIAHFTHIFR